MEIAIMIEGQNGLNWPRWQAVARAVEDLGFAGLFRSDHFTNASPPDLDSLELWVSLTWLASHTSRIEFGPLVVPASFRHPVHTARMAAQIDDLSVGRLRLGLGAGWQEREHRMFGFDLLELRARMDRFEESVEVVSRLLRSPQPVSFQGQYYRLNQAELLPRPRTGGPPLIIGGKGPKRTLPLVARHADEWNATFLGPEQFARHSAMLDDLLRQHGRQPSEVRRSIMTSLFFGRDQAALRRALGGQSVAEVRERGAVAGTPPEVREQLGRLEESGVQRVMLQWLDLDDLAGLEAFAAAVLPRG